MDYKTFFMIKIASKIFKMYTFQSNKISCTKLERLV